MENPANNLFTAVEADRTLAQIVKVDKIEAVEGADRIQAAHVLGWELVVKKDEFRPGDLAIYFSIGSILDVTNPNTSFLEGKPLRTKKIRGIISQGLLGPLTWLKDYGVDPANVKEGDDVTAKMQVKKWVPIDEKEIYSAETDNERAPFPWYVPRTDEERIQNMTRHLQKFADQPIVLTQKFDGTSCTYVYSQDKFMTCSRNNVLLRETEMSRPYLEIAKRYDLAVKMAGLKRNLAIQGEIIGPKINANRHKTNEIEYYVFNVYDIDAKLYLGYDDIMDITQKLGLKMVDLVYRGIMKSEWLNVKTLLELANAQKYSTGQIAEGLVLKLDQKAGPKLSCKIISNNYLIKYGL